MGIFPSLEDHLVCDEFSPSLLRGLGGPWPEGVSTRPHRVLPLDLHLQKRWHFAHTVW